jgi:hypothetical protein
MDNKQKRTIRIIGIVIIIFSIFIAFSNGMGALMFSIMDGSGSQNTTQPQNTDLMTKIWDNYVTLCLGMILIAAIKIIGGLGLIKYKNWGRLTLIATAILFLALMLIFTIIFISCLTRIPEFGSVGIILSLFSLLIIMIPFILLIRYLLQEKIKINFT